MKADVSRFWLMMMTAVSPSPVNATEGFVITREFLLESGRSPIPAALTQTKEGGYVVTGNFGGRKPWATRVDPSGKVQWRYEIPTDPSVSTPQEGKYKGVVTLADDSTLLCGDYLLDKRVGMKGQNIRVGKLTRIDKAGNVLVDRLFYPQDDKSITLSYLDACASWEGGAVVLGRASRSSGDTIPRHTEYWYWLLALDAQGEVKWEKLIPNPMQYGVKQIQVLPNQDIVVSTSYKMDTQVIRLTAQGEIKECHVVPGRSMLTFPTVSGDDTVSLIPEPNTQAALYTVPASGDVTQLVGEVETIVSKKAYRLPDHSLVLFGDQLAGRGSQPTAALARVSNDLREQSVFVFQPAWASAWVADAVPTGVPGEFATIRKVGSSGQPAEPRHGIVLAIVRVQ